MDPHQTRPLFRAAIEAADAGITELAKHWLERRNYRVIGPFTETITLADFLQGQPGTPEPTIATGAARNTRSPPKTH